MFTILEESIAYKRFLKIWHRKVKYPDGRIIDWDVAGHLTVNPSFTVIFPFDTTSKTTTLLSEYCQGLNDTRFTLPSGGFDVNKHKSILETAQHELNEEARLKGGQFLSLLPEGHEGIGEVKWCRNKFIPFLCLNPTEDPEPKKMDDEEFIEIHSNVSMQQLENYIMEGKLMLPSVQTSYMALKYLKDHLYLP